MIILQNKNINILDYFDGNILVNGEKLILQDCIQDYPHWSLIPDEDIFIL